MASSAGPSTAQKTFELSNQINPLDQDKIFLYDADKQRAIQAQRPWKDNPRYFTKVRVSAVALIKMVMHARSGGQYEIMGLMQGKIDGDTFVVMDSFALPVVGTETRVNAASEANEYMVEFLERSKTVGRLENAVGWYHSHPGYGCWLSGIDVATQLTNQTYMDPFVAIVIDPNRTVSAGRVDMGAFRTLPEHAIPKTRAGADAVESVPLEKIEDFGAHANSYYSLEIEHFKSTSDGELLDTLWNRYWTSTLSQNALLANRAYTARQIQDVTAKLSKAESATTSRCSLACLNPRPAAATNDSKNTTPPTTIKQQTQLAKVIRDVEKVEVQNQCGWFGQIVKQALFTQNQDGNLHLPLT